MLEDERREHHWFRTIGVILATLLGAFLAFYFVADLTLNRMMSPEYQMRKMEKMIQHQAKSMHKFEDRFLDNPFEPKMAPMLVNLVKEADEYKIIVDLKPLGGNEKNVNVKFDKNIVTVFGEMDKKEFGNENIINFSQAYYLDENVNADKVTKEKRGNKYIITIPYED